MKLQVEADKSYIWNQKQLHEEIRLKTKILIIQTNFYFLIITLAIIFYTFQYKRVIQQYFYKINNQLHLMKEKQEIQLIHSDCKKIITSNNESKRNQKTCKKESTTQFLIDQQNIQEIELQNKQLKNQLDQKQKQLKQKQVIVNNLINLLDKKKEQIKLLKQSLELKTQIIIESPKKWNKNINQNESSNKKKQDSNLVQKIVQLTKLKMAFNDLKVQLANSENKNKQLQNHNKVLIAHNLKNLEFSVEDTEKYLLNQNVGDEFYIQGIKNQNQSLKKQKKLLEEQNNKLKLELAGKKKINHNEVVKYNCLPKSGSNKNLKLELTKELNQKETDTSNRTTRNHSFMNPTRASLQKQKNIIHTPKSRSKSKSFQNKHA